MSGLKDRAETYERGCKSTYFAALKTEAKVCETKLTDEQIAIMAVVCENYVKMLQIKAFNRMEISRFVTAVAIVQGLMAGGTLRSRQVISFIAAKTWGLI